MTILIDTREQAPLDFTHSYIERVDRTKLFVGDYGVMFKDGYKPPVFFERKTIGDLFGSMGKGYNRFKKEITRANDNNLKLFLIIEGTLTKVSKGAKYSSIEGISIVKKIFTLCERYHLNPIFCSNRKEMSFYITQKFIAIGREYIKNKKG